MAYSDTSIIIHLIKDSKVTTLDDTVRIVKNLEDRSFDVTYKDNGDPLVHKAYQMTRDNVCDYVYLLLKSLTLDEDGYEKFQFSLPAMPRFLISASTLRDPSYRDHFLELIENSLSMIDKVERLSIKKPEEKKSSYRNTCYADLHSSCCLEVKKNSQPNLPESPVHRYFE
jgi:hypothetical protein